MSKKYVIEIPDDTRRIWIDVFSEGCCYTFAKEVNDLKELNSDYINEHFGDLQDTAYQKGLEEGKKQAKVQAHLDVCHDIERVAHGNYQKGLDDAWKLAEDVLYNRGNVLDILRCATVGAAFDKYSAGQALDILKAYKEKQKAADDIKIGDEVAFHHDDGRPDTVVVVTYIGKDGFIDGMDGRGTQYAHKNPTKWTKTGRHFDIDKILEEMSE